MIMRFSIPAPLIAAACFASVSILSWGSAQAGDAQAGEKLAKEVCAACHGPDGNSIAPNFPHLAGQVGGYVADQLQLMKTGQREVPEMVAFVANLSNEDMENLGAYYETQTAKPAAIPEDDREAAERGERLYRGGDKHMQIAACMSCHSPNGSGVPRMYPRVANQHRDYLKKQLWAYKSGERQSRGEIMNDIAFKLSEQQIDDLSAYMHALQ